MYYEEYTKKSRRSMWKRRGRRRSFRSWLGRKFLKLLVWVLVIAIAAVAGLYYLPVSLLMVEREGNLSLTDGLPSSPMNVLVLGVDTEDNGAQRSDTMMIASIDRGALKLTSIQRDMLVDIDGHGNAKINAAYAYGGPELAVKTVNEAFDMNIMRYVVVDFTLLVKLVDALDGIHVDITETEMQHINSNVLYSARVFRPLGYTATELKEYGEDVRLDGLQALGYARIRKIDSDFARTGRQRTVIDAMLRKLKGNLWNPVMVARFVLTGLEGIETNLSPVELISLGEKAMMSGGIDQLRLPLDGTFSDNGSSLKVTDRNRNISRLREFVYGME